MGRVFVGLAALLFCSYANADVPKNLEERDSQGRTALMTAVRNNDFPAAQALVGAGADVNALDNIHDSPFLYAGAEGLTDILKLLLTAHPDTKVLNRYGGTALTPAAHHGYVENVRILLENTDVDVNHVNNLGWTALLEAIILGDGRERYQAIVRLLLDHGADPNLADGQGVTPLSHAKQRKLGEIVRLLEGAGAKP